jgi:murein DD-endopeptidase MepM/ murein hydrolase activator NlpD
MQIIIVDRSLARARTLSLSRRMLAWSAFGLVFAVLMAAIGLYAVTFRAAVDVRIPLVHDFVAWVMRDENLRKERYMRDNVDALAKKLGEMQAQMMRLDALGERVAKLAGIPPSEFDFGALPGRGGPAPSDGRSLTPDELRQEMDRLAKGAEARNDYLNVIETELVAQQVRRTLLPQNTPLAEGFVGSGFGLRIDPITGAQAMHTGIDFSAPVGTPIFAAAGGVVVSTEVHAEYGKTVEIDHGNDLTTLYAHASRIDVKVGDIVRPGQKVAEVGRTGRTTGSHLHFEVHVRGAPQNPFKFLARQPVGSPLATLAAGNRSQGAK